MRNSNTRAFDKYVGTRVRARRTMIGMSQEKLGDSSGITFQQVQKYEKGTNRISASRLAQFAHIMQVPIGFFFEGAPGFDRAAPDAATEQHNEFMSSSDGIRIGRALSRASPQLRRAITELAERVADDISEAANGNAHTLGAVDRRRRARG